MFFKENLNNFKYLILPSIIAFGNGNYNNFYWSVITDGKLSKFDP